MDIPRNMAEVSETEMDQLKKELAEVGHLGRGK
jgi:hypothetical protein